VPQILLFAAVGALAWFGYKSLVKSAERVHEKARTDAKERQTGAGGTLVKDPSTGEYRLRKD
jgi:membrane protein implicated in regulation of membrane protease activity